MTMEVACGVCRVVVYPDAVALTDHHFGYTWWGDRGRWKHPAFGVVHLCDRAAVRAARAEGIARCANPPWLRLLWYHRPTQWLGRLLQPVAPDFPPRFIIREARP